MKQNSILLIFCTLLMSLASCQSSSSENPSDISSTDTKSISEETTAQAYQLPDADYDGYTFKMLARDNQWDRMEVDFDEPQADVIYDAVYQRNLAVEEKYNVTVEGVLLGDDMYTPVKQSVMADTHEYDMVFAPLSAAASMGRDGLLYNYNEIQSIDLSNPWWDKNIVNDLQINDKMYFMTGDIGVRSKDNIWIILFNNPIHQELDLENLYDLVKNGTWTIDKFHELAIQAVKDTDGNGQFDDQDRYGLITTGEGGKNFYYASGERIIDNNNGEMTLVANNERAQAIIEKTVRLFTESNIVYDPPTWQDAERMFAENKGLFYSEIVTHIINLRDMKADFGILPTPKLSEEQEAYYTHCATNGTAACLPISSPDIERCGTIVEALGYYGMEYLTPAFEEEALAAKYSRDQESAEMLDIIWDSVRYDVGYIYNIAGMSDIATAMVNQKSTDLQSFVEKRRAAAEKAIEKLSENFSIDQTGANS
ncbi:MAG: hypothetical protein J6I50_04815 [Clostridia bacterium]|nr:hypothetical protein [Clostridia bacterium]